MDLSVYGKPPGPMTGAETARRWNFAHYIPAGCHATPGSPNIRVYEYSAAACHRGIFRQALGLGPRGTAASIFCAMSGYDFYIYAPKGDPYLRRKWREPMPLNLIRSGPSATFTSSRFPC